MKVNAKQVAMVVGVYFALRFAEEIIANVNPDISVGALADMVKAPAGADTAEG